MDSKYPMINMEKTSLNSFNTPEFMTGFERPPVPPDPAFSFPWVEKTAGKYLLTAFDSGDWEITLVNQKLYHTVASANYTGYDLVGKSIATAYEELACQLIKMWKQVDELEKAGGFGELKQVAELILDVREMCVSAFGVPSWRNVNVQYRA